MPSQDPPLLDFFPAPAPEKRGPRATESGPWAERFATQRRRGLLSVALHVCRRQRDAEELVQESLRRFIRAFAQLESLPDERSCERWLVSTLLNLYYDQVRRKRVQAHQANV